MTLWQDRGYGPTDIEGGEHGRVRVNVPPGRAPEPAAPPSAGERFELGEEIGRGGNGAVHLAEQPSMRRTVVVKRLHEATPRTVRTLLGEAWVVGRLQHPNVVPIHTVTTVEGEPAIAMQRIVGEPWSASLQRDRPARGWAEPPRRHLDVFLSVCNAVAYAHERGIVHLDLKPDNVMVGGFGEVYVVDWGMAAGFGPERPRWLRATDDIAHVAGTPGYMAPEMAAGDGASIGPATDVYLLGATLHHVLLGEPLHTGKTLLATLHHAYASEPFAYPPEVPAQLAGILHRACHVDPEKRFESVGALRAALEEYLAHRQSARLAEEAAAELRALRALELGSALEDRHETRCRFALEQARRTWPENPEAARVRSELTAELLDRAVARDDLAAAERWAAELDAVPSDLARRLHALRATQAAERKRLERLDRLGRELDPRAAMRERRQLFATFATLWLLVNLAFGLVTRRGWWSIGYREIFAEGVLLALVLVPYTLIMRRVFFRNRINARLQAVLIMTAIGSELFFVAAWLRDVPFATALGLTPLLYAFGFGAVAIAVDWRLSLGAALLLVTWLVVELWPAWVFEALAVGGFASAITAWFWPAPDEPSRADRAPEA